jgi:hypothetical protein
VEQALSSAHRGFESRHWWFRGRRRAINELGMLLVPRGGGEYIGDHVSFLDVFMSMMNRGQTSCSPLAWRRNRSAECDR